MKKNEKCAQEESLGCRKEGMDRQTDRQMNSQICSPILSILSEAI